MGDGRGDGGERVMLEKEKEKVAERMNGRISFVAFFFFSFISKKNLKKERERKRESKHHMIASHLLTYAYIFINDFPPFLS